MNYIGGIMKIKKESIQIIGLTCCAVVLIAFSDKAKSGAMQGFEMAGNIVVPSLLPLLIVFNLIMNSDAGIAVQKLFAPITEKVFRLPRAASGAMLFGLIGGYPTGALITERLYENSDIDRETAKKLLRFNVNGGAAFIITGIGSVILKSEKAGFILFASTTASALLIAFLTSFRNKKIKSSCDYYSTVSFGDALTKSTESAVKAVLNISAYIILFSSLLNIPEIPGFLSPVIEITGGIVCNSGHFSLPQTAAFLAFGGLCIHFQLFSIIKKAGMRYAEFFLWRVLHSAFSYALCSLLVKIFPAGTAVFSNSAESIAVPFSVNLTLSVLMMIGCAVIVLDIESRKRKC